MSVDAYSVAIPRVTGGSPEDDPRACARVEATLLRDAAAGDGAAFSALVRPHLPLLYRLAARACGDPSLAEDAVQETLAIAYRRLRSLRPGSSLRAFLAGIAVRRAHTLLRAERRRRSREEQAGVEPAREAGPDEVMEAACAQDRIRRALLAMPKKRRAAAMLRLDAGLGYAEVAEALRTSAGSARVLVHLAVQGLREALHREVS